MFCGALWTILTNDWIWGESCGNPWFITGRLENRRTSWTYNWCLKWGHSCRTESLTCGIRYYLQVDSVRIELNCRSPSLCPQRIGKLLGGAENIPEYPTVYWTLVNGFPENTSNSACPKWNSFFLLTPLMCSSPNPRPLGRGHPLAIKVQSCPPCLIMTYNSFLFLISLIQSVTTYKFLKA